MRQIKRVFSDVKKYGIHSILVRYFICIALVVMLPTILISSCIYIFYNKLAMNEMVTERKENLEMKKKMTEVFFENVIINIHEMSRNKSVTDFMQEPASGKKGAYNKSNMVSTLTDVIGKVIAVNYISADVSIYSEKNENLFLLSKGIVNNAEFEKKIFEYSEFDLTFNVYPAEQNNYILISNKIKDENNTYIGLVTIYIPIGDLEDYIASRDNNSDLYIVDSKGNIIFSTNINNIRKNIKQMYFYNDSLDSTEDVVYDCVRNGETYTIVKTSTKYNSRNYISVVSNQRYKEKTYVILRFIIVSLAFIIFVGLGLSIFISVRLYIPVYEVVHMINRTNSLAGELSEVDGKNEIMYIISHLGLSVDEIEKLKLQVDEKVEMLNKANSKALQMQINPHFIHNALEVINWKIISLAGFENEASEMIISLAKMMRYALETEHSIVTVDEEMENLRAYLNFQKVRLKDKVDIRIDIPKNIGHYSIVKLSLQPMLENVFSHGIKGIKRKGIIDICAVEKSDCIEFYIRDNGVGIAENEAEKIRERLKNEYIMEKNQIGIANVNQRIKIIFGDSYGVKLQSHEEGNTVFLLTIPKIEQKQ